MCHHLPDSRLQKPGGLLGKTKTSTDINIAAVESLTNLKYKQHKSISHLLFQ